LGETYHDLARLDAGEGRRSDRPERLPLDAIREAPSVFQARQTDAGSATQDHHVRRLARAVRALPDGAFLDPVLVVAIGPHFYCVDGHHRLAAYRVAGTDVPVPVEHFEGSLKDAIREATSRNTKAHLPMAQGEKTEAAWRLVLLGKHSKREIALSAGVATATVANMRLTLRTLRELSVNAFGTIQFANTPPLTWDQAREAARQSAGRIIGGEWKDHLVSDWADRLARQFGKKAGEMPDVFALAIEAFGGDRLVRAVIELDPDYAREVAREAESDTF